MTTSATYVSTDSSGGVRQPLKSRLTQTTIFKHFDIAGSPYPETASNGAAKSNCWPLGRIGMNPDLARARPGLSAASDCFLLTHPGRVVDLVGDARQLTERPDEPFDRTRGRDRLSARFEPGSNPPRSEAASGSGNRARTSSAMAD